MEEKRASREPSQTIFREKLSRFNPQMQHLSTCACIYSAELSLDRPIWTSDVAPRPLGGVWVSAVAVISDTSTKNNESMFVTDEEIVILLMINSTWPQRKEGTLFILNLIPHQ